MPDVNKILKNFDRIHFFSLDNYPPNRLFETGFSVAEVCSRIGQASAGDRQGRLQGTGYKRQSSRRQEDYRQKISLSVIFLPKSKIAAA